MSDHYLLCHEQADTGTVGADGTRISSTIEFCKQMVSFLIWHPDAAVLNGQHRVVCRLHKVNLDNPA